MLQQQPYVLGNYCVARWTADAPSSSLPYPLQVASTSAPLTALMGASPVCLHLFHLTLREEP